MLVTASCAARQRGFVADAPREERAVSPFVALAASPEGACAIRQDLTLWCWGHNARQGLGLGDDTRISRPEQVGPLTDVAAVAPGADHTCALRTDHSLYCIGRNAKGQLGNGSGSDSALFVRVVGDWRSVAVGPWATCAVKTDGTLWCWGGADAGAKRVGGSAPARIGDASDWASVDSTAIGRKTDGTATTFGTLSKAATDLHCAVHQDATLWCWGADLIVGSDAVATEAAPYLMSRDADWSMVSTGSEHACALKINGHAYCWGANSFGQLGTGKSLSDVMFERWPVAVAMPN